MQTTNQDAATRILLTNSIPEFLQEPRADAQASLDIIAWITASRTSTVRTCGPLAVKAVWRGAEICAIGQRNLRIDEDNYLVINAGREYSMHSDRRNGDSLTIFFSEATRSAFIASAIRRPAADDSPHGEERREFFAEHLRPHGGAVTQYLQRILEARKCGVTDNRWYSIQVRMLYAQLVAANAELQRRSIVFAAASLSTRTELFRRVMIATDFVNSNYMSPVTLDDMARAAHLSKYHLARLFRALHGVSPAAYLRSKRISAAERLIERSDADLAEIAERSGFGSRWSMFRELRRRRGMSGQRIRQSWTRSSAGAMATR